MRVSSSPGALLASSTWQSSSASVLSTGAVYHVKCVPTDTAASSILAGSSSTNAIHAFTDHPNLTFAGLLTPSASYVLSVRACSYVCTLVQFHMSAHEWTLRFLII